MEPQNWQLSEIAPGTASTHVLHTLSTFSCIACQASHLPTYVGVFHTRQVWHHCIELNGRRGGTAGQESQCRGDRGDRVLARTPYTVRVLSHDARSQKSLPPMLMCIPSSPLGQHLIMPKLATGRPQEQLRGHFRCSVALFVQWRSPVPTAVKSCTVYDLFRLRPGFADDATCLTLK
jgi:hypothetical protein